MGFAFYPQARPDVETHVLPDGSCLLFDPITCEGLALSIVGALVWDTCDGALAWDDIVSEIAGPTPRGPGVRPNVWSATTVRVWVGASLSWRASAL